KKFFLIIEQIFVISIFQYIFYNIFNLKIVPSFYLIYLLKLSFSGERELAILLSFLLGIINDLFTNQLIGTTSIKFLPIIYFSSFFVVKSILNEGFLIFIFSFLYFILLNFKKNGLFLWNGFVLLKYGIQFSFYNFLVGIFIGVFIREINKRWQEKIF
ncbi:MAG: hypothetical protein ACPLZ9_06135, partial [Candidatus Ratteibacteria bacterium]